MGISKLQPMRPALNACIDAINDGFDPYVQPYIDAAQQATAQAQAATVLAQAATQAAQAATEAADDATEAAESAAASITDGYFPKVTVGAADGVKGGGPTVDAAFLHRVSGGGQASDGPATIEVIRGNTLVWNQLVNNTRLSYTQSGITATNNNDGSWTLNGTAEADSNIVFSSAVITLTAEHKYLMKGCCPPNGSLQTYYGSLGGASCDFGNGGIRTPPTGYVSVYIRMDFKSGVSFNSVVLHPQLFDITAMFGAGNEPETVAEFEALYPEQYYPYDAGSLLSVQIEGMETAGFNQWDEEWEVGTINYATGENEASTNICRSKNYIPVFPNTEYYLKNTSGNTIGFRFYDADKNYLGPSSGGSTPSGSTTASILLTMPSNCHYMRFIDLSTTTMPVGTICLNLSDPARNGTYEPHWSQTRSIPATDLRSAGTVYDELRKSERITQVGVVDLGTLTWARNNTNTENVYRMSAADLTSLIGKPASNDVVASIECVKYDPVTATTTYRCATGISVSTNGTLMVYDPAYNGSDSAAAFKTAMSGVYLFYALATPTVTPIDPPLNLSYRAEQGGTETVLVPTGEMSAPVPMVVVYGSTPEGILDRSASLLAAADGPTATAYHAVGSYLTVNGKLYRVTTAIAIGETIASGTNITETTVMEEVIRLTQ